jgi:hypothetical protein
MRHTFNNKLGHRGRFHQNFICLPDEGLAVEFTGKSLPGCRVTREDYTKNGKWSHMTWTCDLDERLTPLAFSQDWETGEWFPERTWEAATSRLELTRAVGSPEAVEGFIRRYFPQTAIRLDRERDNAAPSPDLAAALKTLQETADVLAAARREADEAAVEASDVRKVASEIRRLKWDLESANERLQQSQELLARADEIRADFDRLRAENARVEAELARAAQARENQEKLDTEQRRAEKLASLRGQKLSLADLQSALRSA